MDTNQQVVSTYSKYADNYKISYGQPSELMDVFLSLVGQGRILDAGCGTGTDSAHMASRGFEVTGVDLSAGMLAIAKERFPGIDFRIMDIRSLDFTEKFSGILASFSIIHLPKADVPAVLRNFYRLLNAGGILFLSVQEGESAEKMVKTYFSGEEKIFLNVISREELKRLVREAGFSIIKDYIRGPKENEIKYNKYTLLARKV